MKKRKRCVTYRGRGYKDRRIPANISFLSAAPFAPNFTEALAGDWLHRSFPFASGKYLSSYSPNRVLTAPSLTVSLYIPQLTTPCRPYIDFLIFDVRICRSLSLGFPRSIKYYTILRAISRSNVTAETTRDPR